MSAQHLHEEYMAGGPWLKENLDYDPRFFWAMLGEHGAVETSRRLVMAPQPSEGFTKLWQANALRFTVEAVIIRSWYTVLFDPEVIRRAKFRLKEHRFDVDAYLAEQEANPPVWVVEALT